MTTIDDIDKLLELPQESQRLEFKEAKTQFDYKNLCRYCVAIANEDGGRLLLGISDKRPRTVVGTAAVHRPIEMADKIYRKLGFRVRIEEVSHPSGRVVVFHIPSRPRGTVYNLEGTYLMRSGETLAPMSEDQMRKIFAEGKPDWLEENSKEGLSAQEVVELLDVQAFFELLGHPYPTTQAAVVKSLMDERLVSSIEGGYAISRLGALLLAKRLESFPDISRKAPRVVAYNGASKLSTRLDQIGTKGYAVGFQRLVSFVMSQLPQNEIIEDGLRKESKLLPEPAIRELIANALIHQDVTIPGVSVMVEIYENRVEFSNPGDAVVPVERFIDGYQSRNERLASLMRRMGICEEKGSGIDRVVVEAENYQLPAPEFRLIHQRTVATIYGPKDFSEMGREDRVRACYQHSSLKFLLRKPMTNQTLRERFNLPADKAPTVSQIIAAAIEHELIKPDEQSGKSKKFARYLPFWA